MQFRFVYKHYVHIKWENNKCVSMASFCIHVVIIHGSYYHMPETCGM